MRACLAPARSEKELQPLGKPPQELSRSDAREGCGKLQNSRGPGNRVPNSVTTDKNLTVGTHMGVALFVWISKLLYRH